MLTEVFSGIIRKLKLHSQVKMDISSPREDQPKNSSEPVKQVLALGSPYPMVVLPIDGNFWMEGTYHVISRDMNDRPIFPTIDMSRCNINPDADSSLDYRRHFKEKEHMNFAGVDNKYGEILMSVRLERSNYNNHPDNYRILLRVKDRTINKIVPESSLPTSNPGPRDFMKYVLEESEIEVDRFHHICLPRASEDIQKFDEHTLSNSHKVGIIYQKFGQTTEEEYFQNQNGSPAFQEFLDLLADKVELKNFTKYRGGLDVQNGQTGDHSYHTNFKDREIMFHVSTLLPYNPKDSQQVSRKRHIGNDIVAIIFQEENTPFCPISIRSHFLHVYIIVQVENPNTENTQYKVSITAKDGVPKFSPTLPNPCIFKKNSEFREFLLAKIMNAEIAAMKSEKFSSLANRTRGMLLQRLVNESINKTEGLLDDDILSHSHNNSGSKSNSLLSSFRSALSRNYRAESMTTTPRQTETVSRQHSLSLNDLTLIDADSKKDNNTNNKRFKKLRKNKPNIGQSPLLMLPRPNISTTEPITRSETDSNSSGDTSPVELSCNRPPSRCFTNQLFGTEPLTNQTRSLPRLASRRTPNRNSTAVPKKSNATIPLYQNIECTESNMNNETSLKKEEPTTLDTALTEIKKLKKEVNQLKIDKMDLIRQNVLRSSENSRIGEKYQEKFRRDIYHSSVRTYSQMRNIGARTHSTETQYV